MPRRQDLPVESSWRMVEGGENDSFDTSIVHDDEGGGSDPFLSPPSQLSSGGLMSVGGSQDSLGDFVSRADDERVILRSPFRPSLPEARQTPPRGQREREKEGARAAAAGERTPDPEFYMPTVEVEGRRPAGQGRSDGYNLRRRPARFGGDAGSPLKRGMRARLQAYDDGDGVEDRTFGEHVAASIPRAVLGILSWVFGVIGMAFRYAQRPLAVLLALYLLCGALIMAQNMVTKSIFVSLSPLCRIPGASYLDLPFCPHLQGPPSSPSESGGGGREGQGQKSEPTTGHVEFDDLMAVQAQFEQVLERSADGVSLPLEMKRSESAIRDLRTMVRYSDLSARDELAQEFDGYIDAARSSTSDLQRFNTHVGSAVDSIISVNRWMVRYLDSLSDSSSSSRPGGGGGGVGLLWSWTDWVFSPFQPTVAPEGVFDERALRDRYVEHTTAISDRISALILEATAILRHLSRAESHLSIIYDISARSTQSIRSRRDQILYTLWTLVGGNSAALSSLNGQLSLLRHVDAQRSAAVAQLSALIVDLERIEASLSDLRDRVAEPEVASRGGGTYAVPPLSVHVETIDRGVERLEDARKRIRAVENERIREALARGGVKDERLLEGK
ncbi:uncharacterized protein DNG_04910 [Cephalotrichum gorgonifer]|uniref:Uncharacterized protein n=1 Tax=Cephalotrichum gorgonifer TaxID=2041049 RepID=A0AAE8SVT4_9PEZI|nr:uncharacterized protein DNG_04910 [Cephalotrichum gorgonifer]